MEIKSSPHCIGEGIKVLSGQTDLACTPKLSIIILRILVAWVNPAINHASHELTQNVNGRICLFVSTAARISKIAFH